MACGGPGPYARLARHHAGNGHRHIVLEHREHSTPNSGQRIVIDTKFTSIVAPGQFGQQMLKSGHMYQLYAYLRSQEQLGEPITRYSTGVCSIRL